MNTFNSVTIIGRLTHDPELKTAASGTAIVNCSVAVQRNYKNKEGNYEADFINVTCIAQKAEFLQKHFKKGDPIAVSGSLNVSNYEKDGKKIYRTVVMAESINFLPSPKSPSAAPSAAPVATSIPNEVPTYSDGTAVDFDEALPF